jgi:hypothetical protein
MFLLYIVFVLVMFINTMRDRKKRIIVYSFFIVSILSTLLSIRMMSGPRYGFMPNVLIAMVTLSQIDFKAASRWIRARSVICIVLVVASLIVGAVEYKYRMLKYSNEDWPEWREEVKLWEKDPRRPIHIWPPPWAVRIPAETKGPHPPDQADREVRRSVQKKCSPSRTRRRSWTGEVRLLL